MVRCYDQLISAIIYISNTAHWPNFLSCPFDHWALKVISVTVIIYCVPEDWDGTWDVFCITINYAVSGSDISELSPLWSSVFDFGGSKSQLIHLLRVAMILDKAAFMQIRATLRMSQYYYSKNINITHAPSGTPIFINLYDWIKISLEFRFFGESDTFYSKKTVKVFPLFSIK